MKFTNSAPRDCAGVAPQITALFDGEADAAQTSEARAHLLSCPACSRLWLDWTRHRETLQSEPTPAVPPTLLWRVLIAYRVTAFARPARRRSRLPQVSAAPLRGIEAPLPPRLSAHILACTTRKPGAHVMLTPLHAAPSVAVSPVAVSRWKNKGRSFSFGRAPLWAAPALALWILMMGRADFNATLPVATPDSALIITPSIQSAHVRASKIAPPVESDAHVEALTPIPVKPASTESVPVVLAPVEAPATPRRQLVARSENVADERRAAPTITRVAMPLARVEAEPVRANARPEIGLSRAFALAINTGQRDIARARSAPRALASRARVWQIALAVPANQTPVAPAQTPAARAVKNTQRVAHFARVAPENRADSRVTLAALASPISPVRTLSSARLRTAAFSDDSMRPRVVHPRVAGRRLARLVPDEDATILRVSRPVAQIPALREVSFSSADNGPKLDELRSAIDDFRASVAGD